MRVSIDGVSMKLRESTIQLSLLTPDPTAVLVYQDKNTKVIAPFRADGTVVVQPKTVYRLKTFETRLPRKRSREESQATKHAYREFLTAFFKDESIKGTSQEKMKIFSTFWRSLRDEEKALRISHLLRLYHQSRMASTRPPVQTGNGQ